MNREKLFEPQIPSLPALPQPRREEPATTFKSVVRAEPETIDWGSSDVVRISAEKQTTITGFAQSEKPSLSDIYTVGYVYACTEPEYVGALPGAPFGDMLNLRGWTVGEVISRHLDLTVKHLTVKRELSLWTDDSDTVIAYSATDAVRVWEDHMGCPYEGDELNPAMCWRAVHKKLDDDFELWLDDSLSEKKKMTVREWIAEHGRGWFCTTEF